MGEFLLSILGFNEAGQVVYTRLIKYAKYKVGDLVPIYYPHKSRAGTKAKPYYRVFNLAINPDLLHALLSSRDPDVYDQKGYVAFQREMRDAEIFKAASEGSDVRLIANIYGWIPQAVHLAIHRHRLRLNQRKLNAEEQAKQYQPQPRTAPQQSYTPEQMEAFWNEAGI